MKSNQIALGDDDETEAVVEEFAKRQSIAQQSRARRICVMAVIPGVGEAKLKECRDRAIVAARGEDQDLQFGSPFRVLESNADILADGAAIHGVLIGLEDFKTGLQGSLRVRDNAVDQVAEQCHDLRATNGEPLVG